MGRSDAFIFNEYAALLRDVRPKSVAFLGFRGENAFTRSIDADTRDFYDLYLNGWNINDDWKLEKQYDLIVCTRCPYFACDPTAFIAKCRDHLTSDGHAFIDWGVGAHWKDFSFKVGWVRNGEHEWAYDVGNKLYSCMWRDEFAENAEAIEFWKHVAGNFGYESTAKLNDVIRAEVPKIIDYECVDVRLKFLWPDNPQLYIMTLFVK